MARWLPAMFFYPLSLDAIIALRLQMTSHMKYFMGSLFLGRYKVHFFKKLLTSIQNNT